MDLWCRESWNIFVNQTKEIVSTQHLHIAVTCETSAKKDNLSKSILNRKVNYPYVCLYSPSGLRTTVSWDHQLQTSDCGEDGLDCLPSSLPILFGHSTVHCNRMPSRLGPEIQQTRLHCIGHSMITILGIPIHGCSLYCVKLMHIS